MFGGVAWLTSKEVIINQFKYDLFIKIPKPRKLTGINSFKSMSWS